MCLLFLWGYKRNRVLMCMCIDPYSPPVHRRDASLPRSDEEDEVDRDGGQAPRQINCEGSLAESSS